MTEVLPFVGTRYNSRLIENLSMVFAPPYDVISPEAQRTYYGRHPNNVVRLILGHDKVTDDEYNNKYIRAANYLQTWKRDGILVEDNKKCLYVCEQEFSLPGLGTRRRKGLFALVKLDDSKSTKIRGHEQTFAGPKADRLKLLRATRCNLCPIFALYSDPEKKVDAVLDECMKAKIWETFVDDEQTTYRFWVVHSKKMINEIHQLMADKDLFIADGHHRYEAALAYRDEMREATGKRDGRQPYDYLMVFLSNFYDEGMVILPTHRVLSRELGGGVDLDEVMDDLSQYFNLTDVSVDFANPDHADLTIRDEMAKSGKDRNTLAMILPNGRAVVCGLKKGVKLSELIEEEMSKDMRRLDVSILHRYVITKVWIGNPEIELDDDDIFYVRDIKDVLRLLKERKGSVGFVLNPIPIELLRRIASKGEIMPHKSTFFYPKILSGPVMRDMTSKG
jgi:uncharacterized protein (DUF1015 family)